MLNIIFVIRSLESQFLHLSSYEYPLLPNYTLLVLPPKKAMAAHSSVLAWRNPWTEEPGGLLSTGSHRVRQDWSDLACVHALEKAMAAHSSVLAWRNPWTEEPGGLLSTGSHRVRHDWSDLACVRALEKAMAAHSSVLAWRIPGTGEPGGPPSMGSHRVGHDWSDAAVVPPRRTHMVFFLQLIS